MGRFTLPGGETLPRAEGAIFRRGAPYGVVLEACDPGSEGYARAPLERLLEVALDTRNMSTSFAAPSAIGSLDWQVPCVAGASTSSWAAEAGVAPKRELFVKFNQGWDLRKGTAGR